MEEFDWISFELDLSELPWTAWVDLGEAAAKCEQMRSIPLKPPVRNQLHLIYLAKGVHATTAIEGNTLSEEQVRQVVEKKIELPASKEYLRREVDNIIKACHEIAAAVSERAFGEITAERICRFNEMVLEGGAASEGTAVPGQLRKHNIVVGNVYRAPDAEMVRNLMERYCRWLNSDYFRSEKMPLHFAIIKAIVAHLYIAWMHPFGDGNGRVARLLEFAILLDSGVPSAAAHLLSNHYNMTRKEYYSQLDRASKTKRPAQFVAYAIRGFVDGLNEQLAYVEEHIVDVCWREYVYEQFRQVSSTTNRRRRELVLQISGHKEPLRREDILLLMEREYSERTGRTLARDLNALAATKLLVKNKEGYRANKELMLQFMPFTANG